MKERLIDQNVGQGLVGDGGLYRSPTGNFTMSLCLKVNEKFLCLFYAQNKGMQEYLAAQGFAAEGDSFHTTKPAEMRKLFDIVVAGNDLNLGEVNRLKGLLQADFADTGMKYHTIPKHK